MRIIEFYSFSGLWSFFRSVENFCWEPLPMISHFLVKIIRLAKASDTILAIQTFLAILDP
jgi:hypothetical protein